MLFMKNLFCLFIALILISESQGQEVISNEYYDDGNKVIEKNWVDGNQKMTLIEVFSQKDSEFWYFIDENGIEVGLNIYLVKDYGKYFRADVSIVNNSDNRVDLIIKNIHTKITGSLRNIDKYKNLTYEEYSKIVRRRQNGNSILMGFSAGLSVASSGISYSQSNSSYSGNDGYGAPFTGEISTYTSTYSPALAAIQYKQSQDNLGALNDNQENRMNYINEGYLKNHTIFPKNTLEGYFLIPFHRKISDIEVLLKIENMIFDFSNDRFNK